MFNPYSFDPRRVLAAADVPYDENDVNTEDFSFVVISRRQDDNRSRFQKVFAFVGGENNVNGRWIDPTSDDLEAQETKEGVNNGMNAPQDVKPLKFDIGEKQVPQEKSTPSTRESQTVPTQESDEEVRGGYMKWTTQELIKKVQICSTLEGAETNECQAKQGATENPNEKTQDRQLPVDNGVPSFIFQYPQQSTNGRTSPLSDIFQDLPVATKPERSSASEIKQVVVSIPMSDISTLGNGTIGKEATKLFSQENVTSKEISPKRIPSKKREQPSDTKFSEKRLDVQSKDIKSDSIRGACGVSAIEIQRATVCVTFSLFAMLIATVIAFGVGIARFRRGGA